MAAVFSSKLMEWVDACINIVMDQVKGKTAVITSPVWALLKPRVSRFGNLVSMWRDAKLCRVTNHITIKKVDKKKNQNIKWP